MTDVPDDDPIEDVLARARDRSKRYTVWLDQLHAGDPSLPRSSALYPDDVSAMTWCGLPSAERVVGQRSIAPARYELEAPRGAAPFTGGGRRPTNEGPAIGIVTGLSRIAVCPPLASRREHGGWRQETPPR